MSTIRIAEMFLSVQGEGAWVGGSAVFVRLAGCDMDCPFCDTNHNETACMSPAELATSVMQLSGKPRRVIWTGGEPIMQAADLTQAAILLKEEGYANHSIETNGSKMIPDALRHVIDPWITISPKRKDIIETQADELKVLVGEGIPFSPSDFQHVHARHRFVQPLWRESDGMANSLVRCLQWIEDNPQWRLSVQVHKLIGVR